MKQNLIGQNCEEAEVACAPTSDDPTHERVIGSYTSNQTGPLLLLIGGMHGNEPAGVIAIQHVLDALHAAQPQINGSILALRGNCAALNWGVRYIDTDLNRLWTAQRRATIGATRAPCDERSESREQAQLLLAMQAAIDAHPNADIFALDLHTTSAKGPPFLLFSDTLRNRAFGSQFPVPRILGIEERVGGSLSEALSLSGVIAATFEAGQHDDASTVELHAAAIRLAMLAAGMIDTTTDPSACQSPAFALNDSRSRLRTASENTPPVLDVRHRHGLAHDHAFRMRPGFPNFSPITRGQPLADAQDENGSPIVIRAERSGRILLPLYQGQGDDGYFIARVIHSGWLGVSTVLRRMGAARIVRRLPGVRTETINGEMHIVVRRILAKGTIKTIFVEELFHLTGHRVIAENDTTITFAARPYDRVAPVAHALMHSTAP